MIRFVKGALALIEEEAVVVDVGGIGYRVGVSAMTAGGLPRTGSPIQLYTYLQVKEDAMSLFGFLTLDELSMFERLIAVNGVGPKAALSILGVLSVNDLKFAILSDDAKSITRAPGIGAKTAQRIVMELKDKVSLQDAFEERTNVPAKAASDDITDAVLGLVSLGYSTQEATRAVKSVPNAETLDAQALLSQALKQLF